MGCDKSTASRYLKGRIRNTDLLKIDLIMRRLGASLLDVLPTEEGMRHAILCATTRAFLQARGVNIDVEDAALLTSHKIEAIEALVKLCPLPAESGKRGPLWVQWVAKARETIHAQFPSGKLPAGEKSDTDLYRVIMSGDWQFARLHLPWQVFAILVAVFEQVVEGIVRTDAPSHDRPANATLPRVPGRIFWRRKGENENAEYDGEDVASDVPLSQIPFRDEEFCLLTQEPRADIVRDFGAELSEFIIRQNGVSGATRKALIRLAVVLPSDITSEADPATHVPLAALQRFYAQAMSDTIWKRFAQLDARLECAELKMPGPGIWSAEYELSLPKCATHSECQAALRVLHEDKQAAVDAIIRRSVIRASFAEAWEHGLFKGTPLWRFVECDTWLHRSEFWTAIRAKLEISPFAILQGLCRVPGSNGESANESVIAKLFEDTGLSSSVLADCDRSWQEDDDESDKSIDEGQLAIRRRQLFTSDDRDCVIEPRCATPIARRAIVRAMLLSYREGATHISEWNILGGILSFDSIRAVLIQRKVDVDQLLQACNSVMRRSVSIEDGIKAAE
jgi:hypothetical protein